MAATTKVHGDTGGEWPRLVIAVLVGTAVAFVGGSIAIVGAMSCCLHEPDPLSPWAFVAYGGLAIMGTAPFAIARWSRGDRWVLRGFLGLASGMGAFFVARWAETLAGWDDASLTLILPSFGLAASLALPGGGRLRATRVVAVLVTQAAGRDDARRTTRHRRAPRRPTLRESAVRPTTAGRRLA